jgi:ATP-dependent helicase HrpB
VNSFPLEDTLPLLNKTVEQHRAVVLHAPPGAGKTTRAPIALLDVISAEQGRIVMLEPRRLAAVAAARRMASMLGEQIGETIGYAIRFDARSSIRTRIEVVTDGIFIRRIQSDPGLEGTALVIFDEFHERGAHADLALALCLDVRKGLRPDLKILVMSATLDCAPIASLLGGAPVISSAGEAYPVEERYLSRGTAPLPVRMATAVGTALRETAGDILSFLPGAGEIRATLEILRDTVNRDAKRTALQPLYGALPFEEQERAILPSPDGRKVVLATNIAESSLTIEGVRVVIDGGLTRVLRYDPATGMNRLVTEPISRASAEQRKGRAGRLGPGVCYRLFSRQDLLGMPAFSQPELLVAELSSLVLELAEWGVKDRSRLSWLDSPPDASWESASALLRELEAVDQSGAITPIGRLMARLPLHPRLSRMIVRAGELNLYRIGVDLAALLTERDIFRHSARGRSLIEPDVSDRMEALSRWRASAVSDERTDPAALRSVERATQQLMRLLPGPFQSKHDDTGAIAGLLLSAFPDRICKRREEGTGRFVHVKGRGVRLSTDSGLSNERYLIAVSADAGEKSEGTVHLAVPVSEEQIRDECGKRIEVIRRVAWDRKENRIVAVIEERLGALTLTSKAFAPSDEEATPILCEEVRTNSGAISFSKDVRQYQARVGLLAGVFPEEQWPDLSETLLLLRPEDWLAPRLKGIRTGKELSSLDILPALRDRLTRDQQRLLNERAPAFLSVPSGSRVELDYVSGKEPVLAVKLQELFGMSDTPVIAAGRIKVLLHLLSPARRPVQITRDLKGFWNNAYQQVRKDLKGRYPKHPWPDDPWNAAPTRRTNPRKK